MNLLKEIFTITFIFILFSLNAQSVFYTDFFKGGVTGDGYNPFTLNDEGSLNIYIEPNSQIRKAYLFVSLHQEIQSTIDNSNLFYFNNNLFSLNSNEIINSSYTVNPPGWTTYLYGHLVYDVTNYINPDVTTYMLLPPQNQDPTAFENVFSNFYLIVCYENLSLSNVGTTIILNEQNAQQTLNYNIQINALLNQNIGFTYNSVAFCDTIQDGSHIYINDNYIGLSGGDESVSEPMCTGVRGHFYYQNNQLFSLGNDTADPIMAGTDALANIEGYISNQSDINIKFIYQSTENGGEETNPVHQLFLSYSTPCSPFDVQTSLDTTICPNTPIPLFASGGIQYQWLANGLTATSVLSCTDCPNPTFTGDKSTLLTVQIWNNDTCSVVRPIKINVRSKPSLSNILTTNSDCGANNGQVVFTPTNTLQLVNYQLDNGVLLGQNSYQNLDLGLHTVHLQDQYLCVADTFFTINDTLKTVAKFYPSPGFGYLPLDVEFLQQSTFATTYDWKINTSYFDELNTFVFDSSGTYEVTLYAWQYDESCVDSFSLKIYVYDNFSFSVPNIFSPNNDTKNDVFGISVTNEVEVSFEIFNRWGNVIAKGTVNGKGFVPLWNGSAFSPLTCEACTEGNGDQGGGQQNSKDGSILVSEGTYFYKLNIELKEKLMLPKTKNEEVIDESDFPIKIEGWVQVVR